MGTAFEERVRECVPSEATYVNIGASRDSRSMLELGDGSLLGVRGATGSLSGDGGMTWSEPTPLIQADGSEMEGSMRHLARLKSGHIGAFWSEPGRDGGRERQYQQTEWFRVSEDDGRTWSEPFRVSEPYNNAVIHNEAAVTGNGRIVASSYTLVGKTLRGGSLGIGPTTRAMLGDEIARVGAHGYEHFFTYCWAYYSDDEGRTWSANDGKGKWGGGGELFVTLDFSAGGHWRCNEPAIAEVEPRPPADAHANAAGPLLPVVVLRQRDYLVAPRAQLARDGTGARGDDAASGHGRPAGHLEPGLARRDREGAAAAPAVRRDKQGRRRHLAPLQERLLRVRRA